MANTTITPGTGQLAIYGGSYGTGYLGRNFERGWFAFETRIRATPNWAQRQNSIGPASAVGPGPALGQWLLQNQIIEPPAGALAIQAPYVQVTEVGGSTALVTPNSASAWSLSHLVPAGANCLTVVVASKGTVTATAVTYNGVSLTHVGGADVTSGAMAVGFWYLLNPPTGAANPISVTLSGNGNQTVILALNLSGVSPTSPVGSIASATPTSAFPTLTANAAGNQDLYVTGAANSTSTISGLVMNADVGAGTLPQYRGGLGLPLATAGYEFAQIYQTLGNLMEWSTPNSVSLLAAVAFQWYYLLVPGADSPSNLGFAGQTPTVTAAISTVITPAAGAIALAGATPTVAAGALVPAAGALSFAGQAPTLATNEFITAGAVAFTGQLPALIAGTVIAPVVGALAFTGQAPALAYAIAPPVGALIFAGQAPSLVRGTVIAPPVGALSFAGVAVTLGGTIAPPIGALSFAGQAPALVLTSGATPSAAALTFAGVAPLVALSKSPAAAAFVFAGAAPTQDLGIAPGTGSLNFDGDVAPLDDEFAPAPGALAFSGSPPTVIIQIGSRIVPDAGALAFDADDRDYTAHLMLRSGLKPLPPVPSIPTYPFVQYLQALEGPQQVMRQEAPYLLPEEVD